MLKGKPPLRVLLHHRHLLLPLPSTPPTPSLLALSSAPVCSPVCSPVPFPSPCPSPGPSPPAPVASPHFLFHPLPSPPHPLLFVLLPLTLPSYPSPPTLPCPPCSASLHLCLSTCWHLCLSTCLALLAKKEKRKTLNNITFDVL